MAAHLRDIHIPKWVMAAHLRDIHLPKCGQCITRTATKELRNTYNAIVNYYCSRCAPGALKRFKREAGEED